MKIALDVDGTAYLNIQHSLTHNHAEYAIY